MKNKAAAQEQPYVALPVQELNKIEEQKQVDTFYQVDYNMATVTIFKDGTATLFPGAGLGEGLLFYDLKLMQKMIEERVFPVKGDGSFWEKEKERVLQLNENIPYYCSKVSAFLGFDVSLNTGKDYLKKLTEVINQKFYNQKVKDEEYLYLAIYIGELIRIKSKSKWVLHPEYTLNIYYIPEIVADKNYCDPVWHVVHRLNEASYMPIDVEAIINEVDFAPFGNRSYVEIKDK
jgi:hypothetical protein